ncbi:hypothetical protein P171DRAFT_430302 [Karstenula rhodostoma CBS 690.94]|uniref:Uncharacterized protein n=1 Tax=Karstenula rhodostoma CBS 690.94 TaxID=1392251 RepID=A0A9P4PML2_9PLEO|nr:hypothetical protein P171DRAFT_430302 [Karstenula rhodostoma CBS 690.94]
MRRNCTFTVCGWRGTDAMRITLFFASGLFARYTLGIAWREGNNSFYSGELVKLSTSGDLITYNVGLTCQTSEPCWGRAPTAIPTPSLRIRG